MRLVDTHQNDMQLGGKANNLLTLRALGLNVPPFVVIPAEELDALISGCASAAEIDQAINDFVPDDSFIPRVLSQLGEGYFAIRSSALDEDGVHFSFAGQFESFLFVHPEDIVACLKKVWKSAYSQRVVDYRNQNGLPMKWSIAVIIQRMLAPQCSGVAFGMNPMNGDRSEKAISAVWGLGEGLVSGDLDADLFILKRDGEYSSMIASKKEKITRDPTTRSYTLKVNVPEKEINEPTLSKAQVIEIGEALDTLYKHYKIYQDIEFAYCDGIFYLLQTRPVTSHRNLPDVSGEFIIWDNSNIIESYPGVTTPLTFSFIISMYEAVYKQFAGMMGVKPKEIEENAAVFSNMLGLLNGRVYYNLLSWYRALAMLPGYKLNAEFMEKMMGVKERFVLNETQPVSKLKERLRVVYMIRTMLKNLWALPKMRERFVRDFNMKMQTYDSIDFSKKNAFEIMNLYLDFEQTMLKKWKAPLVNDFFAMIYFGVLQKLVVKYRIDDSGTVHNDLMSGAKDIISTEPIERCLKLAKLIEVDPEVKKLFMEQSPEVIYSELKSLSKPIWDEVEAYLQKFGNRCVGELKLETITYTQRPEAFIKIIKSYVEQGIASQDSTSKSESTIRIEAERRVDAALKGKIVKQFIFAYFLKRSRELVSARENLRFERTRGFGMVRKMFCSLGDLFFAENMINHPRDIFYLTKNELFDHIKGTSVNANLKSLIALRKKEYKAFEENKTSERIPTYGVVYLGNDFFKVKETILVDGDLKGIACCPGKVTAKVQVIHSPEEVQNLNGDILVTSSTDPGWVTLFPTASAILVERGSLLSHSAIVSREMGKPCIVGISGLLDQLKTGDLVEMDGSTGVVKILNK